MKMEQYDEEERKANMVSFILNNAHQNVLYYHLLPDVEVAQDADGDSA